MMILAPYAFPKHISYRIYLPVRDEGDVGKYVSNKASCFISRIARRILRYPAPRPAQLESLGSMESLFGKKISELLQRFCPSSKFKGFQSVLLPPENDDEAMVLFTCDWQTAKHKLLSFGWKAENLLIMPVPEGDYWAYWSNAERFEVDDQGVVKSGDTLTSETFDHWLKSQKIREQGTADGYRHQLDPSQEGLSRGHQLYPFPAFAEEHIAKNRDSIERVRAALSDEHSKRIYDMVLYGKPEERFTYYFENTLSNLQYFKYITLMPGDSIINIGVATGFELPYFLAVMNAKGDVHCVDPDGFDHLSPYVRSFKNSYPHMLKEHRYVMCDRSEGACPKPILGDFTGYKPMTVDAIVERKNIKRIDLIKMDIEGMEEEAVPHMEKTVRHFRPQLAIAVYHKVEHFWDLPLKMMAMCEDYDFYFDIYSPTHFEGIFYAIPRGKQAGQLAA